MIELSSNIVLIGIAFFVLPIAAIYGLKIEKNELLEKDVTDYFRGILAIIIVIGHFSNHLANPGLLKLYNPITGYAVSVFLGLSGYSLEYQLNHRENYLVGFVKKRILRFYVPWVTSLLFFVFLYGITNIKTIAEGFLLFRTIYRENTFNWFMICIIYFYLWFYLCSRYLKSKGTKELALLIVSIAWTVGCILMDAAPHWYNNSLLFFVGVLIADFKEYIEEWIKKFRICSCCLLVFMLFCASTVGYVVAQVVKENIILSWLFWVFGGICFFGMIICVSSIIHLRNTFLCRQFINAGNASLEIFFCATGIVLKYYELMSPGLLSPIIVLACVAGTVCFFVAINRKIVALISK